MTTLSKPVTRRAVTRPAAYGVRSTLIISLHPGGTISIREAGRRGKSEVFFDAAQLYVDGVRKQAAKAKAEKRKLALA
jgi:hypothetical protein